MNSALCLLQDRAFSQPPELDKQSAQCEKCRNIGPPLGWGDKDIEVHRPGVCSPAGSSVGRESELQCVCDGGSGNELAIKCREFLEPKGLFTYDGCSGRNAFLRIEGVTGFEALKLQGLRARRCHWSRAHHMVQGIARAEFRRNSWGVASIQGLHTRAAQQEA